MTQPGTRAWATVARVRDADAGEELFDPALDDRSWLEVPVPGDLHQSLAAAGRIPQPDHGDGNDACSWMEERTWWYRVELPPTAPAEAGGRLRLICHGLDTFATLWLDGVPLGRHRNMFRPAEFDVTALLHPDRTAVLAVRFDPPLTQVTGEPPVAQMRKAPFGYGWDFAPRRPSIGIWRPVEIRHDSVAVLGPVHARTTWLSPSHDAATVEVSAEVELLDAAAVAQLAVRLIDAHGGVCAAAEAAVTEGRADVTLHLADPSLWWTHGAGPAHLYDLEVDLVADATVVDRDRRRIGVRTISLDQSPDPDEPGTRFFRFVVNGEPIPVKGANCVPFATAVGAVAPDLLRRMVAAARDANMNMLRIWGGGVYEDDAFYDAADEDGVLVWQDFMFAGAPYTDRDADWLAEVEAEARHQVRRLRSHASLALWCGNNEVELLAGLLDWPEDKPARTVFEQLLPSVVAAEDGRTDYIASSPIHVNDQHEGDRHAWQVWHGVSETELDDPVRSVAWRLDGAELDPGSAEAADFVRAAGPHRYLSEGGRFVSEYGLASAPALETFANWTDPDQLYLGSAQVRQRLRLGRLGPSNKLDLLVAAAAGSPRDLRDYVELSQLAHAEGLKVGAEQYRRRWPHCGGSLVWQLNDCWPATSWALIDYDGRPKPAYYYLARSFAPVLASFAPTPDGADLWVSNDTSAAAEAGLVVRLRTFAGDTLWEERVPVDVAARSSRRLATFSAEADPATYLSVSEAVAGAGRVAANRHFFAPVRDLARPLPRPVAHTVDSGPDGTRVTVRAAAYALMVHVTVPGRTVRFDDNCFDLEAGEERTVTTAVTLDPDQVTVRSR